MLLFNFFFFFSSRRRHTRWNCDWSSDVCSSDLHFFGTLGMLSIFAGSGMAVWLLIEKFLRHVSLMGQHGPLMIFAAVLLLAGVQMLAFGLLGEMQVRYYHEPTRRAPYSVERILRAQSEESTISE